MLIFGPKISIKFSGLFPSNFVEESSSPVTNGIAPHESKTASDSKVIVKVNAELLDSTLLAVESADPAEDVDPVDMIKNEEICKQMGKCLEIHKNIPAL